MIDASHIKALPTHQAPKEGTKILTVQRGLNTKLHLAVDAHGLPVRVLMTAGTTADCTQAGSDAQYLLAGGGYDSKGPLNVGDLVDFCVCGVWR